MSRQSIAAGGRPLKIRVLHPETSAISEGFDPALSVMAVRPPIYPVSTYCFRNAAEAKQFFDIALGRRVEYWRDLADDIEQALERV